MHNHIFDTIFCHLISRRRIHPWGSRTLSRSSFMFLERYPGPSLQLILSHLTNDIIGNSIALEEMRSIRIMRLFWYWPWRTPLNCLYKFLFFTMDCIFVWHEWWSWIESAFRWIESGLNLDDGDFLVIRTHISESFLLAADSQGRGWLSTYRKKIFVILQVLKMCFSSKDEPIVYTSQLDTTHFDLLKDFQRNRTILSSYRTHLRDKFFSTVCVQLLPDLSSRNFFLDNADRVWFQVILTISSVSLSVSSVGMGIRRIEAFVHLGDGSTDTFLTVAEETWLSKVQLMIHVYQRNTDVFPGFPEAYRSHYIQESFN